MNKLVGTVKSLNRLEGTLNPTLSITANITARGPAGPPGEETQLTYESVTNAIGYIPVNEENTLQKDDINLLF